MADTTGFTNTAQRSFDLKDLEQALDKLRGLPPAKWLLVAPDGRVWASESQRDLMRVLLTNLDINSLFSSFEQGGTQT